MTKPPGDHRTALITTGGIIAVIVAGAFAVGANIGILDASSDQQIGQLAAAGDLVPTTATALAPAATAASSTPTAGPSSYRVEDAGTVAVDATGTVLASTAIDVSPGWTWASGTSDATRTELTFSRPGRSLVFTATRVDDGSIDVRVADVTSAAASTATTSPSHGAFDDHGEPEEHEEHEEHEGRDDDD